MFIRNRIKNSNVRLRSSPTKRFFGAKRQIRDQMTLQPSTNSCAILPHVNSVLLLTAQH